MKPRSLLLASLVLASSLPARAEPSASDRAAAELLFEQARKLTQGGKHPEACPKYAESQRLDPGVGTLLYLADCYERVGKTGSAWVSFREAASMAQAARQSDRAKVAMDRAASLEPKLVRLVIEVPGSSELPGLEIARDGSPVGRAQWGLPTPVDPGAHTVTAQAPGHRAFTRQVDAAGEGKTVVVSVPRLEKDGGAPPPPASTGAPPSASTPAATTTAPPPPTATTARAGSGSTQKTLGLVGMGVGGVALLASGYFGLSASSKYSDAKSTCVGSVCDAEANRKSKDAQSKANLSTIFFLVGAVAGGGGAALYFTAKDDGPRAGFLVVPGGAMVGVGGKL